MDITQLLITAGSLVGVLLVALAAVVPTVLEIPHTDRTPDTARTAHRRRRHHLHLTV